MKTNAPETSTCKTHFSLYFCYGQFSIYKSYRLTYLTQNNTKYFRLAFVTVRYTVIPSRELMAMFTLKAQLTVQIIISSNLQGCRKKPVEKHHANVVTCCMNCRYTVSQNKATQEHSLPPKDNHTVGWKAAEIKMNKLTHKASCALRWGGTVLVNNTYIRKDSENKVT